MEVDTKKINLTGSHGQWFMGVVGFIISKGGNKMKLSFIFGFIVCLIGYSVCSL
jgi:hypothetical protein